MLLILASTVFTATNATALIAGDINDSGTIDAVDVQLTINAALGLTSPYRSDLDFNTYTDAVDVQLVINAALGIVIDGDSDGLADAAEHILGTDSIKQDTDGDNMPDGWEATNNLDPRDVADAYFDSDGDSLTNLEEFVLGTDPQQVDVLPSPRYQFKAITGSGGPYCVSFDSQTGTAITWVFGHPESAQVCTFQKPVEKRATK
ncbi:MAG: hypothetical protein HY706_20925 [Candidatus Hydrogenedentes bacterium]|nr:hypothetical protein [Candidatus Hydrogenedentota bacterium]